MIHDYSFNIQRAKKLSLLCFQLKKKSGKTMTWIHENWSCQGKCPSQSLEIEASTESQGGQVTGAEGSGAIS